MTKKKDTIEISKDTLKNVVIGVLVIVVAIFLFGGFGSDSAPTIAVGQPSAPAAVAKIDMKSLIDDDPFKGSDDAPVVIVEFSDYECPFCTRFYSQTLGQIESEYIDKGLVKFVYRDFPLGFHQNAQKAAEAANCAGKQDKYFEMHDLMFEDGVTGGVESFKIFAQTLGLNTNAFNKCLDSGETADEVKKDMADGQAAGVRGTPAFFINGELISGAQPFSVFKQAIDAALAN